ncbi:hypothetical protein P4V41_07215 [Fictibacillus nanhaiensis]|uniref:hypothetical protein n=1 Tax=Fictibacillus nanhaiensis TaxID=742169 RepID=UPI002E1F0189|nr:hypothetical protein [Fictibacillus nanhaiensis]
MEGKKSKCACCGNLKSPGDFYYSSSPFHKLTGKLHACKQCIWDQVGDNYNDLGLVKTTLRRLDKPFILHLWQSSISEAEKANKNIFKIYMKNLGLRQNRDLTWEESETPSEKVVDLKEDDSYQTTSNSPSTNDELKKKWGSSNLSGDDIEYLENFYKEYSHNYATDTPVQINLYRNIAKVHLQAEKELSSGNIKVFKDLMELSSKLHNDGNIKPIQSTGANDDKGLSAYGLWIKTIENDEPCEFFENKPIYQDYDKFQEYIDKWFVRPFKNIFNISKDFNVKDDN